jgi:uncharacterized protein YwgA
MTVSDALLFAYEALGGSIQGKTNLQKKMYFLGIMLNEDFGYGPHYYGPYSARVASANQELKSLGYLSETKISAGGVNTFGFEMARHDFCLTEDGRSVLKEKKARLQPVWERLERAAHRLMEAGNLNYMEISIAAKAYFLLEQQGKPASADELAKLADKFGWTVSAAEIEKAVQFLTGLELATMVA